MSSVFAIGSELSLSDHRSIHDLLSICQTCGMCLGACPTYDVTRDPDQSPRGRIRLIKAVADGVLAFESDRFVTHTWNCIQCRACETICPSAVPYHVLATAARVQLVANGLVPPRRRYLAWALRNVFPRPRLMRAAAAALRLYQRSGAQWLARRSGLLRWFGPGFVDMDATAPRVSGRMFRESEIPELTVPDTHHAASEIEFFDGCVMPLAFADVHRSAIRFLARFGVRCLMPRGQGCCGALHVHAGEIEAARRLARANVDAYGATDSLIVTDSAGCAATLKDYGSLLAADPAYAKRAAAFARRVREFSEFATDVVGRSAVGQYDAVVTYQDACQLLHGQHLSEPPRQLLRAIEGVTFVEAPEPTLCCGSGGTYALTDPEMGRALQNRKIDGLIATGAHVVVTCNPGCLTHLQAGARERRLDVCVLHLAEVLDQATRER